MIIIIGTIIGSFLATLISNFPNTFFSLFRRSKCNNCNTELNFLDLIPVVSYLFFKGRCRYCCSKMNAHYIIIEILTPLLFYLVKNSNCFVLDALFISILVVISFIDLEHMIIPNNALMILFLLSIIKNYLLSAGLIDAMIGALSVSSILGITYILTKGVGIGDIKLMFVAGFYLGLKKTVFSFIISSCLGGIFGIYMLTKGYLHLKSEIPYAPFLSVGILFSLII